MAQKMVAFCRFGKGRKFMEILTTLILALLSFGLQAHAQRGRVCKLPVHDQQTGCVLCGNYQINGYCQCVLKEPCLDGPGAAEMEFIGSCVVPNYCGAFSAAQSKTLAVKNQAKYAYWLRSTNLPAMFEAEYPVVKRGLEAIQRALLRTDVSGCAWAADTIVIQNKQNPDDPIYAELKDMGNAYRLDVRFESDKTPRWTLHLFPNGWSLENGEKANLLSGSY